MLLKSYLSKSVFDLSIPIPVFDRASVFGGALSPGLLKILPCIRTCIIKEQSPVFPLE